MNKTLVFGFMISLIVGWFSYSYADEVRTEESMSMITSTRTIFDHQLPIVEHRNIDKTVVINSCGVGIRILSEAELYVTAGVGGNVNYLTGAAIRIQNLPLKKNWAVRRESYANIKINYAYDGSVLKVDSASYQHPDHTMHSEYAMDREGKSVSRVRISESDATGKEIYSYTCEEIPVS